MTKQRFRRHHDQRLAEIPLHLPPEDVEIVRRRGAVGNLHVVFRAHLQEALETGRRVLRSLPLIAVWQQADEARHAKPFALARGDELVEQHLRAIGEVAELGFPQRQRIRPRQRVAILKPEHRLFRQHRVDHFVTGLVRRQVGERNVALLGLLIIQHRVPLAEGAALDILARQTDLGAFRNQRAEGQRLGKGPVDSFAGLDHLGAVVHEPLDGAMRLETFGHFRQLLADFTQLLERHPGLAPALLILVVGGPQPGPLTVEPVGLVRLVALADVEFGFQIGAPVGLHLFEFALGDHAFLDQAARIERHDRLVAADLLVHLRLRERRLVALVVAEAAVAEHVDDHRLVEGHAEFGRNLGGIDHRFRIVAIDVEDRRLDHLGHIGRVRRRAREARIGGETDLVVDDEMHGAGNPVTAQA